MIKKQTKNNNPHFYFYEGHLENWIPHGTGKEYFPLEFKNIKYEGNFYNG